MRRLLAIALLCVAPPSSAARSADDPGPPAVTTAKLVEAAKANKPKRKSSTSRVITDKDVKSAKGSLIELPGKVPPVAEAPQVRESSLQDLDARHRARIESQDRVRAAMKSVTDLEKELEVIEQQYYEENNPTYRDEVIRKRFAETKRALDEAREALVAAVGLLDRLDKP